MDLKSEIKNHKKERSYLLHGVNIFLIFLLVLLISLIKINYDNQLNNHSLWDSVKSKYRNELKGVHEFLYSRKTLWKSKLHLEEWGGFNEVIWKGGNLHLPLLINLDLSNKGEFTLVFSKRNDLEFGVKIRGDKFNLINEKRSFFFSKGNDMEYSLLEEVGFVTNESRVKLYLTESHLVLNQHAFALPKEMLNFSFNKLSLRGGRSPVAVDSLMFGFEKAFRYSFDYLNELWGWVIAIGSILSGLYIALLIIFKLKWKGFLIAISLLNITFGIYEVLDRLVFKGKYPQPVALKKYPLKNSRYHNLYWLKNNIIPNSFDKNVAYVLIQNSINSAKGLHKVVSEIQRLNKTPVLVDSFYSELLPKDDINNHFLKNKANELGITFLNLNPFLFKNKNRGEIWLNHNHLTLLGKKLVNQEVELLLSRF
ncbi:MAG: hypothetical protein HN576_14170 [Bacteriovoracaceae bacterium]|jgi:hypothetical protein|nr:hypothetical protein [Bacteriovoracaceae bacterium]